MTLTDLPSFGAGSTYAPVNADGGKAFMGGYRAERNALLKFIAENHIANVVFMATDDHQNRINELTYSPTSQTESQPSYVKVPYCSACAAAARLSPIHSSKKTEGSRRKLRALISFMHRKTPPHPVIQHPCGSTAARLSAVLKTPRE